LEEGREGVLLLLYYILIKRLLRVYVVKCFLIREKRAILYMAKKKTGTVKKAHKKQSKIIITN
jgi:hypothetical protein